MCSEKVIDHFMSPQNVGSMSNADGEGTVEDQNSGNSLTIYVKVQFGIITEVSFMVYGCSAALATGSMTTVLAKGKSLEETMKITEHQVIDALGGLPEEQQHCSNLAVSALRSAIYDYLTKRGAIYNIQVENEDALKSYSNKKI